MTFYRPHSKVRRRAAESNLGRPPDCPKASVKTRRLASRYLYGALDQGAGSCGFPIPARRIGAKLLAFTDLYEVKCNCLSLVSALVEGVAACSQKGPGDWHCLV
jgi:hypothetical protein